MAAKTIATSVARAGAEMVERPAGIMSTQGTLEAPRIGHRCEREQRCDQEDPEDVPQQQGNKWPAPRLRGRRRAFLRRRQALLGDGMNAGDTTTKACGLRGEYLAWAAAWVLGGVFSDQHSSLWRGRQSADDRVGIARGDARHLKWHRTPPRPTLIRGERDESLALHLRPRHQGRALAGGERLIRAIAAGTKLCDVDRADVARAR